ncbi:Ltp family lipoprotein [Candidatus Kirkpatrickella diaphorinae]|nr:Ltp family lipoprotein [Candidatus Kirkpatrickella diaphorinae]
MGWDSQIKILSMLEIKIGIQDCPPTSIFIQRYTSQLQKKVQKLRVRIRSVSSQTKFFLGYFVGFSTIFICMPSSSAHSIFSQMNAARSAKQYIAISGFSRRGLIEQLSSDVGNGYDIDDATRAVDSLHIDWNAQAVRSAKLYLKLTGFSCKGLIQQLSSSAGDRYTPSEAAYGAKQVGACQ